MAVCAVFCKLDKLFCIAVCAVFCKLDKLFCIAFCAVFCKLDKLFNRPLLALLKLLFNPNLLIASNICDVLLFSISFLGIFSGIFFSFSFYLVLENLH